MLFKRAERSPTSANVCLPTLTIELRRSPAGYSFYSHLVSTRMLPLRRLVRWTRTAHSQLGFDAGDRRVLFAASHK